MPFRVALSVRGRTPSLWRQWRRVALGQALVTLGIGALLIGSFLWLRATLLSLAASLGDVKVEVPADWGEMIAAAFAVLSAIEWLVIAFSREHQEQLTRAMTESFALPPEDPLAEPRIRLDWRWLWRRVRRWARGIKAIIGVLPAVLLLSLALSPFALTNRASGVVLVIWSFYWGSVIACSKTAYAWRSEGDPAAPEPRYVRSLRRWPIISLLGRFLGRMTRSSAPAVREVDAQPWEFLGLAGARLVLGIPVLYAFIRPTLPVAALLVLATPLEPETAERPALEPASPPSAPIPGAGAAS